MPVVRKNWIFLAAGTGLLCAGNVASARHHAPMQYTTAAELPAERQGISNSETARVELPPDFDMERNRVLRMRTVKIAPGGALPMHSHRDRPSVTYVLSGTLTEFVEGEAAPHVISAGQSNSSFLHDHALANNGVADVEFIEVDIPGN